MDLMCIMQLLFKNLPCFSHSKQGSKVELLAIREHFNASPKQKQKLGSLFKIENF